MSLGLSFSDNSATFSQDSPKRSRSTFYDSSSIDSGLDSVTLALNLTLFFRLQDYLVTISDRNGMTTPPTNRTMARQRVAPDIGRIHFCFLYWNQELIAHMSRKIVKQSANISPMWSWAGLIFATEENMKIPINSNRIKLTTCTTIRIFHKLPPW